MNLDASVLRPQQAPSEFDPNGVAQHAGGSKLDAGKVRPALVLGGFARERSGENVDPDTGLLHAAHEAWNSLARLDLILRQRDTKSL